MLKLRTIGRGFAIPASSIRSAFGTPARSPSQGSLVPPGVPVRQGALWLGCLLVTALLVTATPALGAYPTPPVDGSAGKTGAHSLVDTVDTPGGTCTYGYEVDGVGYYNGLRRVRAGAPVAFARAGRTSQQVAWRLLVEAWDGTRWLPYDASTWQSRVATPTTKSAFSARSVPIDSYPNHATYGYYRARIDLRWYGLNGTTIVGSARHFPGYYRSVEGMLPEWQQSGQCSGTTG